MPSAQNTGPAMAGGALIAAARVTRTVFLCLAAAVSGAALATTGSNVEFDIRDVAGEGWRAEGVSVTLTEDESGVRGAILRIGSLALPSPLGALRGLEAECRRLDMGPGRLRCGTLVLGGTDRLAAWPTLSGPFEYRSATGLLNWRARVTVPAAGERREVDGQEIELNGGFGAGQRSASIVLDNVDPGPWLAVWPALGVADGGALAGRIDAEVELTLPAAGGAG